MKEWLRVFVPSFILRSRARARLQRAEQRNVDRTTAQVFSEIYANRLWGGTDRFSSGPGSTAAAAVSPYVAYLRDFFAGQPVPPVVVDIGCGDFRVASQFLDRCGAYIGIDVVPELIAHLQSTVHGDAQFTCLDAAEEELPRGDVCLIRQVLQHLSNAQIRRILGKLHQYKVVFITEHYPADDSRVIPNLDKVHGSGIRLPANSAVYLDRPPFDEYFPNLQLVLEVPDDGLDTVHGAGVIRTYRSGFPRE